MDYDQLTSPSKVKALMREYQIRFNKRLGQNFLVDRNILNKIVASAELKPDQYVIEIGTGLGTLTHALAKRCRHVVTFEVDSNLVEIFRDHEPYDKITLIHSDALEANWQEALITSGWQGEQVSLVANLPYYLTSPLIMKALENQIKFESIVIMVQKEVADRMKASPGTKQYGLLTLAVEFYAHVEIISNVPRTVFMPAPDVDSAIVRLKPHRELPEVDEKAFFAVVKAAFNQRRKTLRNGLKTFCRQRGISGTEFAEILAQLDLPSDVRGETLSLNQFCILTQQLMSRQK